MTLKISHTLAKPPMGSLDLRRKAFRGCASVIADRTGE